MRIIAAILGLVLLSFSAQAQVPTVQDCDGAIPVCQNVYSEVNSYSGVGNYPGEINAGTSCLGGGEVNDVWYTFNVQVSGNLCFSITPNISSDDYDWAVYDLTNNPCSDIATTPGLEVSCNFSGSSGVTGANGLGGAQNNPCMAVVAGQTLVLNVSNWSGTGNGYTLDFGASTAAIFDNVPPAIQTVQTPIACGATTLTFNFSEAILCNTMNIADLVLNGPGGPYTITSIIGAICAAGGTQEDEFTITFNPAITTAGNYTLDLVGGAGSVTDLCGNPGTAGSLPFVVTNTVGYNIALVMESCVSSDDGTITVTGNGGTAPYTYDITGPSGPQTNGTGTFDPLIDGDYDVLITDASGCSNLVQVTIDPGLVPCCATEAGTTNQNVTGQTQTNYILCDGDFININGNGDDVDAPGPDPGISYAIFSCPPTIGYTDPALDPCYTGYVTGAPTNMTDQNIGGSAGGLLGWLIAQGVPTAITNNTLYFAPMNMTDMGPLLYDPTCVEIGPAITVQYLEPILYTATENCGTASWDVVIDGGGWPDFHGGNYTISNVAPGNAVVTPMTIASGGTVHVTGLVFGDVFTFDLTDPNGCSIQVTGGPYTCCPANAGTATPSMTGFGQNNYILCDGDQFTLTGNGDHTNSPGIAPGITYGIYTCPPTPGIDPATDPCYTGYVTGSIWDMTDTNTGGSAGGLLGALLGVGAPVVDNILYFAPFTLIDTTALSFDPNCNDVGPAVAVQYLEPITYVAVENCATLSWDITVNGGGYDDFYGGGYTVSNLVVTPANGGAALSTGTVAAGGTVSVTGLNFGDTFTFDIIDVNGCPMQVVGGPYACCPAFAGTATGTLIGSGSTNFILCDGDAISIISNGDYVNSPGIAPGITFGIYTCPPTPGIDPATDPCYTGFVTGTIGSMIDVNSGGSSGGLLGAIIGAGIPVPGNTLYFAPFTLIDTVALLYDPNCFDVGPPIAVTYLEPLVPVVVVTPATCGNPDGTITITAAGGSGVFTYEVIGEGQNLTGVFNGLLANTYQAIVIDDNGCSDTIPAIVNDLSAPTINATNFTNPTCNLACDGTIIVTSSGGTAPLAYDIGGAPQGGNSFTGLCAGGYTVTLTDAVGCIATDFVTLVDPPAVTFTTTQVDLLCFEDSVGIGNITFTAQGGDGIYSYSINNGNTFLPTASFDNLGAGTYDLIVQDGNNCQATAQVTITEPPVLYILGAGAFDALCEGSCSGSIIVIFQGGTQILGGPQPYDHVWSDPLIGNDPAPTGMCAGTYDVTGTDANGCSLDTTFIINSPAALNITQLTTTDVICNGDCDGSISVTAATAVEFSTDAGANWSPANVFPGQCADVYTVMARDANGCSADSIITITEPAPLALTVSTDTVICIGGTATLVGLATGGAGNYVYDWTQGLPGTATVTASPLATTTYSLSVFDGNSCPAGPEEVDVTLLNPLVLVVSPDVAICPGDTATLTASATGGDGNYVFDWNNGQAAGPTYTVTPGVSTTYTVTLSDGCSTPTAQDDVTVTVNPTPIPTFSVAPASGCAPFETELINTTQPAVGITNCQWFIDGLLVSTNCSGTDMLDFPLPGGYDVTLTFESAEGCIGSTTEIDFINAYGSPTAAFSAQPQPANILDAEIFFTNLSTDASIYSWEFGDTGSLGTSIEQDPTFIFPDTLAGSYDVCLTAYNQFGCLDTVCDTITIDGQFLFYVPNAFTPDNDGLNDYFMPLGYGYDNEAYAFMIFDRWGELIFNSYNVDGAWDGTVKGTSTMAKTDVYVWKVVAKDNYSGNTKEYVGHVTLLR
jgi:gliding motility-associated-like protein